MLLGCRGPSAARSRLQGMATHVLAMRFTPRNDCHPSGPAGPACGPTRGGFRVDSIVLRTVTQDGHHSSVDEYSAMNHGSRNVLVAHIRDDIIHSFLIGMNDSTY